jgi:acyl carrier protein
MNRLEEKNNMDVLAVIKKFIKKEIMFDGHGFEILDDTPLIEKNIIDSLGIMKLLMFIEEKYSINIGDEELIPENFETPNSIANLLRKKIDTAVVK